MAQMKTLRVEQVLQRSSFVPPVPYRAKAKKQRTVDGGLKRRPNPQEKAVARLAQHSASSKSVKLASTEGYDVWAVSGETLVSSTKSQRAASEDDAERPKLRRPAVPHCLPGQSFNPEYEAHQDALGVAVGKEMEKQLASELFPVVPPAVVGKISSVEAGLLEECYEDDESESEDDTFGDASNDAAIGAAKQTVERKAADASGKLTRTQRNKQQRHKVALKEREIEKERKRKQHELDRVKSYQKEIDEEERARAERRERRERSQAERRLDVPRRLGIGADHGRALPTLQSWLLTRPSHVQGRRNSSLNLSKSC
eukprot:scaffold2631_cov412-Prasinococcus_capsulatus_cf.AAC.19